MNQAEINNKLRETILRVLKRDGFGRSQSEFIFAVGREYDANDPAQPTIESVENMLWKVLASVLGYDAGKKHWRINDLYMTDNTPRLKPGATVYINPEAVPEHVKEQYRYFERSDMAWELRRLYEQYGETYVEIAHPGASGGLSGSSVPYRWLKR